MLIGEVNGIAIWPIVLPYVQVSDTTGDDSSNAA